jgi:hypothetical protein
MSDQEQEQSQYPLPLPLKTYRGIGKGKGKAKAKPINIDLTGGDSEPDLPDNESDQEEDHVSEAEDVEAAPADKKDKGQEIPVSPVSIIGTKSLPGGDNSSLLFDSSSRPALWSWRLSRFQNWRQQQRQKLQDQEARRIRRRSRLWMDLRRGKLPTLLPWPSMVAYLVRIRVWPPNLPPCRERLSWPRLRFSPNRKLRLLGSLPHLLVSRPRISPEFRALLNRVVPSWGLFKHFR